VERVGDGRNVLYRVSSSHPLSRRIVKLFRAEAKRASAGTSADVRDKASHK
jgi:hypothetical protein